MDIEHDDETCWIIYGHSSLKRRSRVAYQIAGSICPCKCHLEEVEREGQSH